MSSTPNPTPGTAEAIQRAKQLSASHPAFVVHLEETLPQGQNNRLLAGRYEDRPVVFKYYDDRINKPGAAQRKRAEEFAIQHWQQLPEIPRLELAGPDFLVIERFSGSSFTETIRSTPQSRARELLDNVGSQIGDLYARLAAKPLAAPEIDLGTQWERRLDRCRNLATQFPDGEATLDLIRQQLPAVLAESQVLYRYDNNFGNLIIDREALIGLVDFEQCYTGTESMLLGAMLDTVPEIYPEFPNRPSWPAIRQAYETRRGRPLTNDEMVRLLAMAMFNHWRRILETLDQVGTLQHRLARFQVRFPVLLQMAKQHGA